MSEKKAKNLLTFVETPVFVEQLAELAGKAQMELLYAIQDDLMMDPERGDLMKGLGGLRKARIADPHKKEGKRGGFRYLYLYLKIRGRIHLLYLYSKREQSDLSEEEKKQLSSLVEVLKKSGKGKK
ncbi:MAG: type II toxin-antitoxin system RelE/ParE family toxin [Acidobacteriota bacterium]|nr:MAG: type II toxin-antitoxin system RelE/ParE family toxin [Acidobacteriota bacterium]